MNRGGHMNGVSGDEASGTLSPDLELLKQEILKEIRRDLTKMKLEILDGKHYKKKLKKLTQYLSLSHKIRRDTKIMGEGDEEELGEMNN